MDAACMKARQWLKASTRSDYNATVDEAKLTPTQEEVLQKHIIKDWTITKISMNMNISERQVSLSLRYSYEKIAEILQKNGRKRRRKEGIIKPKKG